MRVARELRSPLGPALALTAAALFAGGGFGSSTLPWLGAAAALLSVAAVALGGVPGRLWTLAPLAALAAWSACSVAWSIEPDRSWDYADRAFVYLAFALVGTTLAGRTRALAAGLGALLGAVCAWALAGKVLPWLDEDYGRIARLRDPVGYWNALALLGDVALPLGLSLATRRRVLGALLVYGWLVAIALTYSRGGIGVAVLVVAAWLALTRAWPQGLATLVAAGVPAAAVVAGAFALAGITRDGTSHATRVHDGLVFGGALLAGAGLAAALARIPPPEPVPAVRQAAAALAIVAAAAACLLAGFHARTFWAEFTAPPTAGLANGGARIAEAGSNHRFVWWQEAWRGFEGHELAGTGAGSFAFTNLRYRTTTVDQALEPHDLPVQFLSELGAVGLALFLLAALLLVAAARRAAGAEVALALALPAYLLHGLVDIDWDFAAVSGPVFLVAGALAARPRARPAPAPAAALLGAGAGLALVASLLAVWLGDRWTSEAYAALATSPERAVALARRARAVQPLAVDPLFAEADAEELLGHPGRALGLLQEATTVQPANKETWFNLGEFWLLRGCPRHALDPLDRFTALDRQDPGNAEYARALRLVDSGTPRC